MRKNRKKSPSMTSLRNHRDVQTLSVNCNSRNIDHPVTALHMRKFHSLLHRHNPITCRCTTTGVPTSPRTAPEESRRTSAQFALCTCLCEATGKPNHTVDELKLRHLHVLDENLLERSCVVTETSTTSATVAAASICIPPWPGGVELLE